MIKLIISRGVHVYGLPKSLRNQVYYDLTFDNKAYKDAQDHGRYISPSMMPQFHFFSVNKVEKCIYIPRGYIHKLLAHIRLARLEYKIIDKTLVFKPLKFTFHGTPRDYQELALEDLQKFPCTVLEASTGAGKTFVGINMIAVRKQPTLILVHSKELLYQWERAIKKFLKIDPGILGDGKFDIQNVTVGIVNSVRNNVAELETKFGHIILDEVHRCPANMWIETLALFPARYYLGLSATVFRNDGLGGAISAFVGPIRHKVSKTYLHKTGAVLKPHVIRVRTRFVTPPKTAYSTVIKNLTEDDARNRLIVDTIAKDIRTYQSPVLIVSDRVKHCEKLTSMIEDRMQEKVSLLVSKTSDKNRKSAVDDIRTGASKILIATLSLIGEGFDAPNLHGLFLTTPIAFEGRVVQTAGRILRPEKGKSARLYDFRDDNVWMLRKSGKKRDKIYREEWG